MTAGSYSVFNAMVDIVASPAKALQEVKNHTSWLWWPLLINMLLAAGLFIFYYSWVDFSWLVEETIRQVPVESRAESEEAIRSFMQPGKSTWVTVAVIVVVSLVIYTLQATYLHLANKLTTGVDIGFGQWFSFSAWTSFVGVFGTLAGFVMMLMTDPPQLSTQDLTVFSLNNLVIHAAPGEPWFTWASSLTLLHFWTFFLMSIGYAQWTGASTVKATVIAVLPWVLIFGIWALTI